MIRTMLSSVAVAATVSMAVSGHALSGDVDGRDFLIVYAQREVDPLTLLYVQRIFARRVLANGAVIDAASGFTIGTGGAPIDAAWRDHRYLIAFAGSYPDYELRVREVDPVTTTTIADTLIASFATSAQLFGERSTIVYSRTTEEPLYGGAVRVFTRELLDETRRRATR